MPTKDEAKLTESDIKRMASFVDNTRFINMIKNKPSLDSIPIPNRRILAQRTYTGVFVLSWMGLTFAGLILNQYREKRSLGLYNTRKQFSFRSDPYSSTVNCHYNDVPYTQTDY